ncbi:MAG: terminase TerL endonuclease subunit [Acutalibacteraceae bacterium]|uniref:Large Terminase n=1 Tax=Myoviridae sp. ctDzM5 TaxID=2825058 RepID=A0A8S5V870_9CAUD|nr:terminase TerL endonuclease subunit [Acutalibacteraceae bacterium]DAG02953.1 MAG TPA: Large Terminase [Myoviridae sp. ctDzM5]
MRVQDRATLHAERVVSGQEPSCLTHRMACERHLNEIAKQGTKEFPFVWCPEKSEKILRYAEMLTIAEGAQPRPVRLHDFQCFDLGVPFGWVHAETGFRRIRRKYKSVARQNGKTFENGITGSYIANWGGYNFGKLFTAATKKRQARIAWEEIQKFITVDKDLQALFDVKDYKSLIIAKRTGCTIEALSRESGLDDGFRAIFCSVDEIHQHKDNGIYKALYNGQASLDEALISMITTRGKSLNSFCREMDDYCLQILAGTAEADDFFVDIYTLDKEDDPFDESVWYKANPHLVTVPSALEQLRRDAQTAKQMGGFEMSDYMTKRQNLWYEYGDTQYITPNEWKLGRTELTIENMRGRRCFAGLDLSSGGDLTSLALLFPLDDGKIYIWSHSYIPAKRLEEHIITDTAPYDVWAKSGLLTPSEAVGGLKNDYLQIVADLKELQEKFEINIACIGYDPHNADAFLEELDTLGAPLLEVKQSARFLSDTTVDFALEVKAGNVLYDQRNALMSWSIVNAKKTKNSFGEIKVDKEVNARHARIDVVDAIIDAHVAYRKSSKEETPDYETVVEDYLKKMGWA